MVAHREFSAWINCDGIMLDEYEVRVDVDGPKATCWIPSIAGKNFAVHWKDHGTSIPTAAYIVMDGCTVAGRFLWGHGETFRSGVRSGPNSERPFVFAKIDENSTVSKSSEPPNPQDVGVIVLKIKRVQRGDPRASNRLQVLPGKVTSEWNATTGGHCVTFDREVPYYEQYPTTWSAKPWESSDESSYVKFIFRYRPIQFLQAQGIAPAQLSPPKRAVVAPKPPLPIPGMIMWTSPQGGSVHQSSGSSTPTSAKRISRDITPTGTPTRMPSGESVVSTRHSIRSISGNQSSRHCSGSTQAAKAFDDYIDFGEAVESDGDDYMEE